MTDTKPLNVIIDQPGGTSAMLQLQKTAEMKVRYVQMGKGHLKIYTRIVHGVTVLEAFTLQSLAECMGMAAGTMEGRYARSRLYRWKVDIPTGESRPVRGFPLQLLEQVMLILTTRGARVHAVGNEEGVISRRLGGEGRAPLTYERYGRENYITVAGLAEHYGRSITTIRSKLDRAGLLKAATNLNSPMQGGRPKRGWPVSMEAMLVDAIENGAQFHNEFQAVLARVQNPQVYKPMRQQGDDVEDQVQRVSDMMAREIAPVGGVQVSDDTRELVSQLEGLLKRTSNPITIAPAGGLPGGNLQPWADKLHAARDKIWEFDAVIDEMRKAGLSDEQINEAVTGQYTRPSVSGQERSEGGV